MLDLVKNPAESISYAMPQGHFLSALSAREGSPVRPHQVDAAVPADTAVFADEDHSGCLSLGGSAEIAWSRPRTANGDGTIRSCGVAVDRNGEPSRRGVLASGCKASQPHRRGAAESRVRAILGGMRPHA